MDALNSMLQGAGLFEVARDIYGGSGASGFIARMMAENRVKNKGAYGPKTDLPKGSMMSSPRKFELKRIANKGQKKGATNTKDYGASPFLLKHFGVPESDNPLFKQPRYTPKKYRTPLPDAPFKLDRKAKKVLSPTVVNAEIKMPDGETITVGELLERAEAVPAPPAEDKRHEKANKQFSEMLDKEEKEGTLKEQWDEEWEEFKKWSTTNKRGDAYNKWYKYLVGHADGKNYTNDKASYEQWSHAPPMVQKAHGLKGGEIAGNPDPAVVSTMKGPSLIITKGPTQPDLKDYFAIKNMAHIIDAIIKSKKYIPKEEWLQQLLIATRLVDEGQLHPKGTTAPTVFYKKDGPNSVEGHQDYAIEQYNKGEKAIIRQYEKSGLKKEIDLKSNAWIAKQPLKPGGGKATAGDWVDKVLIPDIMSNQEERQLGQKAYKFLTKDI